MKGKKRRELFSIWNSVSRRLVKAGHWLLLFDLDGTLAAITPKPDQTVLESCVRESLRQLAARPNCFVGIISGRSVSQVRRIVRLPALTYVGNHGLEIHSRRWSFLHPKANRVVPGLERMEKQLKVELQDIPGAAVENKTLGLSVHYRRVNAARINPLIRRVRLWWKALPESSNFELRAGKKVLEIRPALGWNKGSAVLWLKRFVPPETLIVYAGDDDTDEDAFKVLRRTDISIHVGPRHSSTATYALRRQADIPLLLQRLLALSRGGPS